MVTDLIWSGGIAALISSVIGVGFKFAADRSIEKLKDRLKRGADRDLKTLENAYQRDLETLKSDLAQLKTKFDSIYQRRAEAATQIYGQVVELQSAWNDNARLTALGDQERAATAQSRYEVASAKYRSTYPPASVWFEKPVVDLLCEIDALFSGPNTALTRGGVAREIGLYSDETEGNMRNAISKLQEQIQGLLGP